MILKKISCIGIASALLFSTSLSSFAFGLGDLANMVGGGGQASGATTTAVNESSVEDFLSKAKFAEQLTANTVQHLNAVFLSKEQRAELDAKLKSAESIADPKEREATIKKVHSEGQALLVTAVTSKDAEKHVKELDAKEKLQFGNAMFNLFLLVMTDQELLARGSSIVTSASSNPLAGFGVLLKVGQIKDAISSISEQLKLLGKLPQHLSKLAKAGNIEVAQPKSTSDKPKTVDL